jgi:hypothetical protein
MPPGYGPALPSAFYAGPEDPLVSPDYSGWWNRTVALIRSTWRPMALIQLFSVVPVGILTVLGAVWGDKAADRFTTTTASGAIQVDWDALGPLFAVAIPLILIGAVLGVLINLATMQLLVQRATGQPVSVAAALRVCLSRALPLIGWSFVAALVGLAGLLCCILPVIYVAAALCVLPAVVLLERGVGVGRCFQLFHGNLGASVGRVATIGALALGASVVENLVNSAITVGDSTSTVAVVISAVVTAAFSVATGVVSPALLLTTYADMRARLEPFSTAYLVPAA